MALMTQKLTEPGIVYGAQGTWALPAASWTTSERYAKNTLTNPSKNSRGDWCHQLRGRGGWGVRISIVLQNIGGIGNALYQLIQHKLDNF